MVTLGMAEILKLVEGEKSIEKKVEILHKNDSKPLRDLLRMAYDKKLKWLLPDGMPPIKENGYVGQEGNLYSEWRRMYLFIEGADPLAGSIKQIKREQLFIQVLESCDKADAELLCAVKDKKMPFKSVTKALINKAFPGLVDFEAVA